MKNLVPGVRRLNEFPRPLINVYLAEDVLIDSGRRWDVNRIRKQTAGRELSMVALTHVHADHQGSADAICEERQIPLACHEADVDAMEGRRPYLALRTKLDEPSENLTPDSAENRRSIRKLAELKPTLILPGHGPAVTDMAAFERFVAALD